MSQLQPITLAELKGGALEERFQIELGVIIEALDDPNRDTRKSPCKMTIELRFLPSEDETGVAIDMQVKSKVPPVRGTTAFTELARHEGALQLLEAQFPEARQQTLTNVRPIGGGSK